MIGTWIAYKIIKIACILFCPFVRIKLAPNQTKKKIAMAACPEGIP